METDEDEASFEIYKASRDATSLGRSILPYIHSQCALVRKIGHVVMLDEILREHNGDRVFELPPASSKDIAMEGMRLKYDGHLWTKPITCNISFEGIVCKSSCAGASKSHNPSCPRLLNTGKKNDPFFK